MVEQTIVLIKPDGVMMGAVEEIKQRYLNAGLTIVQEKALVMRELQARDFYREHESKPFFFGLVLAMTSGPSVALLLEGENAIRAVRDLNGAFVPREAKPGTIRHDFQSAGGPFNTVHGSDSSGAAKREMEIIFGTP